MRRPICRLLRTRRLPIAVLAVALVAYNHFSDGALSDNLFRPPAVPEDPLGQWDDHPVVVLHQKARAEFQTFLARQSKTPDEAEGEYRRRYRREPPPGFRQWAEYALANGSPVIDDFDIIAEGVHPFLKYSAEQINQNVHRVLQQDTAARTSICEFSGGRFGRGCRGWGEPLTRMLGDARRLMPDLELYINFLDEPSLLLGTAEGSAQHTGGAESRGQPVWTDLSHRSIATTVAETCRARGENIPKGTTAALNDELSLNSPPREARFVSDAKAQKNLCRNPQYASQHGFVACPTTLRKLSAEVPILSRAAPQPFSDVLFPATHYSLKSSLYSSWSDRSWGAKKNAVYWTGSSTGGQWSPDTWRKGHRQRLVALATGRTAAAVDRSRFDVALTRIVGCAPAAVCDDMARFFAPGAGDPEGRPLRYRFALDVDGNSFSGRFYRLLASRSVPLKITIFREWHDERLRPWVHYVPVSVGMEELPELVEFLTSTATGQRVSQSIAEAGRQWYQRAMAPKHQGIYMYRLMLEMARLQDGLREAG